MNRIRSFPKILWLVSVTLIATIVQAKSVDERKWILLESANFAIHSSISKKKTIDLMNYLEALRSIFVQPGSTTEKVAEKSTVIFVLGKESDYEALGFSDDTVGMFLSELRQNFIVIRNSSSMQESQVILHEYVHFIMQATSRFPYPRWWREGYAEYVSSSHLTKKGFSFGLPLEVRARTLGRFRWLPWEEVIDPVRYAEYSRDQVSLFYAQSWLLVHFLHNRRDKTLNTNQSWQIYLDEMQSGNDPILAFEKGFDLTLSELEPAVSAYFRRGRYQYWQVPVQDTLAKLNLSVSSISQSDIQISLGHVALRHNDAEQAREWFSKSLSISPGNALALAGLASSYAMDDHHDEAEEYFLKALDAGADVPQVLVDYAKFALERASSDDTWFTSGDHIDKAEKLLLKAKGLAGFTAEIDTYLALTYLNQDKDPIEASQLLAGVVRRSPSDQWPMLLLAQIFQMQGLNENAIAMAELVLRTEHKKNSRTVAARKIIAEIEDNQDESSRRLPKIAAPTLPKMD